jgi:hypothetical protein
MKQVRAVLKNILPFAITNYFIKRHESQMEIPSSEEPPVYNEYGQRLKTIFLQDEQSRHDPYRFVTCRYPKYILWDRNNYGLKNHVYSHMKILSPRGKPVKKFAFFIESEAIEPKHYTIFDAHKGLANDFDLIFTHSARLLDTYKNAVFVPGAGVWYGTEKHGGIMNPEQYKIKTKNISLVSSEKTMCDLHKFRIALARHYKNSGTVDTYGTFDGGSFSKIVDVLEKYRYSIIVENDISPYWFTEKIMNCFASMTVPIYIGATKIGDFFNDEGIIKIPALDFDLIDKIAANCNDHDYASRVEAVIDNYNRVQAYLCLEDYLYTRYKKYFI